MQRSLNALLWWREWRSHPWRHGVAALAVAMGVALAFSVHLINRSALAEFAIAVRSANGQSDVSLRAGRDGFAETIWAQVAAASGTAAASAVVEFDTYARVGQGERMAVRVLGVDALQVAQVAPELLPQPGAGQGLTAALDPSKVFLNATARAKLGQGSTGTLALLAAGQWREFDLAGTVAAGGTPTVVMDIAAAQNHFGWLGRVSRVDVKLQAGTTRDAWLRTLSLPPQVRPAAADEDEQRLSNLSRAYRVNLTVLALVALLVGAFMVYSVMALSVAQRTPTLALLAVLGMTASQRRTWVLGECAWLGLAGSLLGVTLGTGMAWAALRWLAGDLGGGYFSGGAPVLAWDSLSALGFGGLGLAASLAGGWWPARQAERLPAAQALKGQGTVWAGRSTLAPALGMLAVGVALAFAPAIGGLPLAAYASVAALLFGGVALVPTVVSVALAAVPTPERALPLLALQRARFQRHTATAAVAGVVASLALCVALTVMVGSFRSAVMHWLDQVLPADLYARTAIGGSATDQSFLDASFAAQAAKVNGVLRVQTGRVRMLELSPGTPAVALLARPLGTAGSALPLVGPALPATQGELGVYASESAAALHGAQPGTWLTLPLGAGAESGPVRVRVLGVWRDYARQFGTLAMEETSYRQLTGDRRVNELALWLAPEAKVPDVQAALRQLAGDGAVLEFAATQMLRETSLRIFDRSFAVTRYLQGVAILIGLVGVAASLSAQVLARRKEFGLLAHLGLTRAHTMALVAGEATAWLLAGAITGLALGAALSVVLVHVVNPQSFHWTMELVWPWPQLLALSAGVVLAGVATATLSARSAAGRMAVLSVKEDW